METTISFNAAHTVGLLKDELQPDDRFLDVGCGSSEVGHFLEKDDFKNIHNIDFIDMRDFDTKHFLIYDGIHLPFEDNSMDIVAFSFVLHHVSNEKKKLLIKEAMRVTSKRIFVLEDTPRNPIDWVIAFIHGSYFRKKIKSTEPFGFYSRKRWEKEFKSLGLKVIKSERLSRFCRTKDNPSARSMFVLNK